MKTLLFTTLLFLYGIILNAQTTLSPGLIETDETEKNNLINGTLTLSELDLLKEEATDVYLKILQDQSLRMITFEYSSHGTPWELEIRDLKGLVLLQRTRVREQNLLLNSSGFTAGTYFCTLYTSNSTITKKVILQ